MHDVTLVILNSLRIKCHIRRSLIKLTTVAECQSDFRHSYKHVLVTESINMHYIFAHIITIIICSLVIRESDILNAKNPRLW